MSKQLTNKRKLELTKKWGNTDDELSSLLGIDNDDGGDDISEMGVNCGYIWSFRLERWFDKSQGSLDEDEGDFNALLDEVRNESER